MKYKDLDLKEKNLNEFYDEMDRKSRRKNDIYKDRSQRYYDCAKEREEAERLGKKKPAKIIKNGTYKIVTKPKKEEEDKEGKEESYEEMVNRILGQSDVNRIASKILDKDIDER